MKKVMALLMALVLVLSLAACGGSEDNTNVASDTSKPTIATEVVTEKTLQASDVKLGDVISLDFVSMTLDLFEVSDGYSFENTDNSSGISVTHKSSIDCPSDMKLVCLKGKFTNKSKGEIYTSNSPADGVILINGSEYKTRFECYSIKDAEPLLSLAVQRPVDYFYYAEVPESVATSIDRCEVYIGFVENLDSSKFVSDIKDYDYLYKFEAIPATAAKDSTNKTNSNDVININDTADAIEDNNDSENIIVDKYDAANYVGVWETFHFRMTIFDDGSVEYLAHDIENDPVSSHLYEGTWEVKDSGIEVAFTIGSTELNSLFVLNDNGNVLRVLDNNLPAGSPDETEFIKQ